MDTVRIFKDLLIPITGIFVALFAASQSISVYKKNRELEGSKWLFSLFENFFTKPNIIKVNLTDYMANMKFKD